MLFVAMSNRDSAAILTVDDLLALSDSVARAAQPPYERELRSAPLLAARPTPGTMMRERAISPIGDVEWVLSNGVHVVLKSTDFNPNELFISATAPGGTSVAPDSMYISATLARDMLAVGGLGRLSKPDLIQHLCGIGSSVIVTPDIGQLNQGVNGHSSPRDAETLLQLIHLFFTAPRVDSAAIAELRESLKAQLAHQSAARMIRSAMTRGHPRARPFTPAMVDSLDVGEALAFYRARFADASNFTFYIVGAFDPDSLLLLVKRYFGGLPATHGNETWRDLGIRPPSGAGTITIRGGPPGKVTSQLLFTGEMAYDKQSTVTANALKEILQRRLLERLRTEMQGTYGVEVELSAAQFPYVHYQFQIAFDAAPKQAELLRRAALVVINTLKSSGPTADEVAEIKALQRRQSEVGARDNRYWMQMLSHHNWNGWDYEPGILWSRCSMR